MSSNQEAFLQALQSIDAYKFESLIAELWEEQGWETEVTTGANDRETDVIATRDLPFQQKVALQAKRYDPSNTIGSPDIQQYASLRQQVGRLDAVIIVTTSSFTTGAQEIAESLNVKLIGGDQLYDLFEEHADPSLLNGYRQEPQVEDTADIVSQSDPVSLPSNSDASSGSAAPIEADGSVQEPADAAPPASLAEVISLGESLSDDVRAVTDTIETADEALEQRNFDDAIEAYSDAQTE